MPSANHVEASNYWESIPGEFDIEIDEVTGALPRDLVGTLYRNGTGRWKVGESKVDSIFDADGMVSAFIMDGSRVRFRNRFVRTDHYQRSTAAGRTVGRGITSNRSGGLLANVGRRPANTANTSLMINNDALYALWEAGRPHELDLDTLDTIGMCSLGGALKGPHGAFSAHHTYDSANDTFVNFGFDPFPRLDLRWPMGTKDKHERRRRLRELVGEIVVRPKLRLYETDRTGTTRYIRSVALPNMAYIHDMALTARYAVFVASPWRIDPLTVMAGSKTYWESMYFEKDAPAYLILAPRDGGRIRVAETDPFYIWHHTNAYDDGDDVVVEVPRFAPETFAPMKEWTVNVETNMTDIPGADRLGDPAGVQLTRFRISAAGLVTSEALADLSCELPQFDQRRSARMHNISYVATPYTGDGIGIARIDHRTGRVQTFSPSGQALVEPTFVPRTVAAAEDDGWILTVGHDEATHRSRLMVFDAAHIDDGPSAEAWLPFNVPMSFHGAFTTRVAR
jgi:all-trans-8'-apo-beta-carotenal 15,15'-oxygenase